MPFPIPLSGQHAVELPESARGVGVICAHLHAMEDVDVEDGRGEGKGSSEEAQKTGQGERSPIIVGRLGK